jgi:acyl carrier protein
MEDLKTFIQQEIKSLAFVKVGNSDSLLKAKVLDSITFVELLVSVEEKTGKKIPQHLITEEKMDTIDMICATLEEI